MLASTDEELAEWISSWTEYSKACGSVEVDGSQVRMLLKDRLSHRYPGGRDVEHEVGACALELAR
jgi:hypothetical protein